MTKRDYYEVLGVDREVEESDLKKAYRKLARKNHPDTNPDDPQAEERLKEINEAFAVLSDDQKRAEYDRFGHDGVNSSSSGFGSTVRPTYGFGGDNPFTGPSSDFAWKSKEQEEQQLKEEIISNLQQGYHREGFEGIKDLGDRALQYADEFLGTIVANLKHLIRYERLADLGRSLKSLETFGSTLEEDVSAKVQEVRQYGLDFSVAKVRRNISKPSTGSRYELKTSLKELKTRCESIEMNYSTIVEQEGLSDAVIEELTQDLKDNSFPRGGGPYSTYTGSLSSTVSHIKRGLGQLEEFCELVETDYQTLIQEGGLQDTAIEVILDPILDEARKLGGPTGPNGQDDFKHLKKVCKHVGREYSEILGDIADEVVEACLVGVERKVQVEEHIYDSFKYSGSVADNIREYLESVNQSGQEAEVFEQAEERGMNALFDAYCRDIGMVGDNPNWFNADDRLKLIERVSNEFYQGDSKENTIQRQQEFWDLTKSHIERRYGEVPEERRDIDHFLSMIRSSGYSKFPFDEEVWELSRELPEKYKHSSRPVPIGIL